MKSIAACWAAVVQATSAARARRDRTAPQEAAGMSFAHPLALLLLLLLIPVGCSIGCGSACRGR